MTNDNKQPSTPCAMKTPCAIKSQKMVNNKITITRLIILGVFFFLFTWGGHWFGSNLNVILPIFNCEYVGGGTTRGLCIAIIDFNKRMTFQFLFSFFMCIVTMFLIGRVWCGYICPMGFVQDVMTIVRQKFHIPQFTVPEQWRPFITILKWYCVFYIIFYDICRICPIQYFTVPVGGYTSNAGGWAYTWAILIVITCTLSDRAVCRVCPIGALTGLCNKVSGARIKKVGAACTHCRACLEACPMDIQAIYEDREHESATYQDCIYCMKCIEVCPEKGALRFELFGAKILESRREVSINLGNAIPHPLSVLNEVDDDDELEEREA